MRWTVVAAEKMPSLRCSTTSSSSHGISLEVAPGALAITLSYEAFDRDAIFAANADASKLSKIPTLAIVCQNPVGTSLERQLVPAGVQNAKGANAGWQCAS